EGLVTGSVAHAASTPLDPLSKAQVLGKPRVVRSGSGHSSAIFATALSRVAWIFSWVAASGHGPGIFPTFWLSMHFSVLLRTCFFNLASCCTMVFWHLTGSAATGTAAPATSAPAATAAANGRSGAMLRTLLPGGHGDSPSPRPGYEPTIHRN